MKRRGAPSARKERGGPMQDGQSQGTSPNGSPHLTRAAIEGGKGRGKPLLSSARQRRTVGARGGSPDQTTPGPPAADRDQVSDGSPPPQPRKQNACGKEEGGGTDRACPRRTGRFRERGGPPCKAACAPNAWHARTGGGKPPKTRQRGGRVRTTCANGKRADPRGRGGPPVRQRALPAHGMPKREEGIPRIQEDKEGAPPEQHALLAHGMHGQGGTQNSTNAPRGPPE